MNAKQKTKYNHTIYLNIQTETRYWSPKEI